MLIKDINQYWKAKCGYLQMRYYAIIDFIEVDVMMYIPKKVKITEAAR